MKITNEKILKIIQLAGEPVGDWFLAGRASLEVEFVIIAIPLWFNIIQNYFVFTDTHMIVATQTLWSGITAERVVAVSYENLAGIEITTSTFIHTIRWQYQAGYTEKNDGFTEAIALKDKGFAEAIIQSAVGDYVKLTTIA